MEVRRKWFRRVTLLWLAVSLGVLAGVAQADGGGGGRKEALYIYPMQGEVLGSTDADAIALKLGLKPPGPANGATAPPGTMLFVDASNHVRMLFMDGSVRIFPDLTDPTAVELPGRGQSVRFAETFLRGLGISGSPAMLGVGEIVTLTQQPAQMGSPTGAAVGGNGGVTLGKRKDVLRTVEFRQMLDGLPVYGPTSILSLDIGPGGVVLGGAIHLRKIGPHGPAVSPISPGDALKQFLTEFPYKVTTGEGEDDDDAKPPAGGTSKNAPKTGAATVPDLTGRLVSENLIYFEQGGGNLQPAYLFHVLLMGPTGLQTGLDWLVPAVLQTPEPILNHPITEGPSPILASPSTILPALVCEQPPDIKYGRYILREDDPGWLVDVQGFGSNIDGANAALRFWLPTFPAVNNYQYYWNYPWLWEPTGSPPTDDSPSFPGSVNVALIEGHGGPWIISTLKNCCDAIDLPLITGFGGYHNPAEITDYVIWQSCDVVPAPGDPYGHDFQSPATPFDLWFNLFQGLRGTYGYRTTMNIWNGVGKAMGGDMGFGAQNLSAWFTECNNNVFGHNSGWNYGSAVLISGHEGDTIYDTCPLSPPGSLTIWWQHP
ncbi:MAG: hypothetical protein ACHQPI_07130 [Thermoanaerobaculia bacterium]